MKEEAIVFNTAPCPICKEGLKGKNPSLKISSSTDGTVFDGCVRCFDEETKDKTVKGNLYARIAMNDLFRNAGLVTGFKP